MSENPAMIEQLRAVSLATVALTLLSNGCLDVPSSLENDSIAMHFMCQVATSSAHTSRNLVAVARGCHMVSIDAKRSGGRAFGR